MARIPILLTACLGGLLWQVDAAAETAMQGAIRAEIEALAQSGGLSDGGPIESVDLVVRFYERRDHAPAWRAASSVAAARDAFRASREHGLDPADYGIEVIEQWSRWRADFDVWLTDRVARFTFDLRDGATRRDNRDDVALVESIIDAESIADAIGALAPATPRYAGLMQHLARYRAMAEAGGWGAIPAGPTIEPGSNDARIAALAKRLAVTGDLAASGTGHVVYDAVLEGAIRRFQTRHGLDVDGLVGKQTLRALNVPVDRRVDQLLVNLERQRWMNPPGQGDHILVNVPAFEAHFYRDTELAWTTKVIIGEPDAKTPLFESKLTTVIFNPAWSVPYSIASKEMLPKIQRDPDYLRRGNYRVFDRAGNLVDPASVDWGAVRQNTFPFMLEQQPGPGNELGRIKFLFPNPYSVCMHDTPGKALFDRARRSFSHGCIRVDEPQRVAEIVLARQGWTAIDVRRQLRSGETFTVALESPVPIAMVYWTADVDDEGALYFHEDIYERDAALLAALERAPVSERVVTE